MCLHRQPYYMNESSENQNSNYGKKRVEVNKEILYFIQGISKTAIEVSGLTFVMTVVYIVFTCCKAEIKMCIIETGTATPLFILSSTVLIEGKVRVMEWASVWREKRKAEKKVQDVQDFANAEKQGEAKIITALQQASKEGLTIEQALEKYESKNGK